MAWSSHEHLSAYHKKFGHEEIDKRLYPFSCPNATQQKLHVRCKKRQKQLAPEEVSEAYEVVAVFEK